MYIERFLERHQALVRGRVLEVSDASYTRRFGGAKVTSSSVLDVDETNPNATLVADLAVADALPAEAFECIILTQTLQLLDDPCAALRSCWTALRPGGALLLTVPALSRRDPGRERARDLWRFMPDGLGRLLERVLPEAAVTVSAGGNLVTSLAYLLGLAAEDLRDRDFAVDEDDFPLNAQACVRKRLE